MKLRSFVLPLLPVFLVAGIFDFCDPPTEPAQLCNDGSENVPGVGCPAPEPPPLPDPPPEVDYSIVRGGSVRNVGTGFFSINCEDTSRTVPPGGLVSVCWTVRAANGITVEIDCSELDSNPRASRFAGLAAGNYSVAHTVTAEPFEGDDRISEDTHDVVVD